jgi:glutamate/tyrosine decarboxylase-like PLP-dependent enzyme
VRNYRDWGIALGRRFRALKLWFVLRYYGAEGLRARLREHLRLARLFAEWVEAHPDFERLAPAPLNLICFRYHPASWKQEATEPRDESAPGRAAESRRASCSAEATGPGAMSRPGETGETPGPGATHKPGGTGENPGPGDISRSGDTARRGDTSLPRKSARLDVLNQRLLEVLNDTGKLFLTHTRIRGVFAIRMSIGQTYTEERHVRAAWELIKETALTILQEEP